MSRRLALLSQILRLTARPLLARTTDPVRARADFERSARWIFRVPPYATLLPGAVGAPAVPGLWVQHGRPHPRRVILFLHGGGYVTGSPRTHAALAARLSKYAGLRVFLPDYRLAPEHAAPAQLEDARAAWEGLVALGYDPDRIVLAGDSAGGGIAFALLAELCARGTPPALVIGFAPWVDLTGRGGSVTQNGRRDSLLPVERFPELVRMVAGGMERSDPRISPLFGRFPGAPPVLLQVADGEILRDDSLRLAKRLREFGAEVTVQRWPHAIHVFQMFDGWVPEARAALMAAGQAVRARFTPTPPSRGS